MKKKTKKILIWVLAALAAAIVIWLVFGRTEKDQETVQVTRGNIETYYTYSGTLEASKKEDVMAGGSYTIDEVYVGAGSVVDEDTLLMDADLATSPYREHCQCSTGCSGAALRCGMNKCYTTA